MLRTAANERQRTAPPTASSYTPPVNPQSLRIISYPAEALRKRAENVERVTPEIRDVAHRMIDLMREAEGIGLAAPQVGLSIRLFVAEVPESEGRSASQDPPSATTHPLVFINPAIDSTDGPPEPLEEGCLSLPDIRGTVLRPPVVTVSALDAEGQRFSITAGGLLARCLQHEFDHLEGVLIIDRMTQMSRLKTRAAIRDLERDAGLR